MVKGEGFFLKSTVVRVRTRAKVGEFRLKTPNDFSKVGRCFVLSPESGERLGGATSERATEERKRVRRFSPVYGDRDVHSKCIRRLPREYTKIPFDAHRKGSPQEKCA